MAFRRFSSFKFRGGSSRFRSRPVARRKMLWVNQITTVSAAAGPASGALISPALWVLNASSGNMERARFERLILIPLLAGGTATTTGVLTSLFSLYVDDTTSGGAGDPSTVTYYDEAQPFYSGLIELPQLTTGGGIGGGVRSNGFRSNVIDIRVKRKVRTDQSLWVSMSQWGGGNISSGSFTFQWLARALLSLD